MNWEALGALAELAGAVAVFATLVYLALQIRASTRSTNALVRQNIADSMLDGVYGPPNDNDALQEVMHKALAGEPLDDRDRTRWTAYLYKSFRVYEIAHRQHEAGFLSDDEWLDLVPTFTAMFDEERVSSAAQTTRQWWRDTEYSESFRSAIERALKERGIPFDAI